MFISDLKYFILSIKSIEKMNVGPDTMTSPTGLSISALVVIMLDHHVEGSDCNPHLLHC